MGEDEVKATNRRKWMMSTVEKDRRDRMKIKWNDRGWKRCN